jgi:tRNA(fMet)-specific endonuclease VapC
MRRHGFRIGTCVPVLCELEAAYRPEGRREAYRRAIRNLLGKVRVWPIEKGIAPIYGEIFLELRNRGRVLSQVDMMLAALARSMSLTMLTSDNDFEAVPDLRTENWLV